MKITSLIILVSISIVSYSQSSDESTIKKVNVDVEKMKTEREHQIKSVQVSSTSNNEGSKEIVKTLQNKTNQTQSYSTTLNTDIPNTPVNETLSKEEYIEKLEKSIQSGESKIDQLSDDFEANQMEIKEKKLKVQQWKEELESLKK